MKFRRINGATLLIWGLILAVLLVYLNSEEAMQRKQNGGEGRQAERIIERMQQLGQISYTYLCSYAESGENPDGEFVCMLFLTIPLYQYSIEENGKKYELLKREQLVEMTENPAMERTAADGPEAEELLENVKKENAAKENEMQESVQTEIDSRYLIKNVTFENIGLTSTEDVEAMGAAEGVWEENVAAAKKQNDIHFQPAISKTKEYELQTLSDTGYLLKNFYAVDSGTTAPYDCLDASGMLAMDMTVNKQTEGPQILIYHTHSQEAFADSVPGKEEDTIVGAGELLTQILENQYGYRVLHHKGQYDTREHDYAYSYALPEISRILEENPSIQVVIDLHRDEMPEGKKLLTEYDGRPTAQIMFFNGLSYVNSSGAIAYLKNPNLASNLAFSFQMQKAANEYYPGFARRIYLKGYRYNMHLKDKYLLIELGAQTNTVAEIQNACYPLADVLDKVIGCEAEPF